MNKIYALISVADCYKEIISYHSTYDGALKAGVKSVEQQFNDSDIWDSNYLVFLNNGMELFAIRTIEVGE